MQNKKQDVKCEWKYISYTEQGNRIVDVVRTSFKPACHIKRVNKTLYMKGRYDANKNFVTLGEVFETSRKESPMRNRRSLRKIFKELRQLITHNCEGGLSELFVTLTYAEQTSDPKKLQKDFHDFWLRLKRAYSDAGLEYISVVEPHASGNFHIHVLIKATKIERLFIPNEVMEKIWSHGFTKTERLEDIDHIGAYVIAYMSNLEIPPEFEAEYANYGDIEEIDGKKYIKGKRLDFYPDGMQISRHSKGMTRPDKLTGDEAETALDLLNGMSRKTFSNVKEIEQKRDDGSVRIAYVETSQLKTEKPW